MAAQLVFGGRVNDPRFDFTEVIWSTLRNAAVKAITAPVSWIGRVRFSDDSRIQRIEVDPMLPIIRITRAPAMPDPSSEGRTFIAKPWMRKECSKGRESESADGATVAHLAGG